MILYIPRFLSVTQCASIRGTCPATVKVRKAPVSQRAWATGAQTPENFSLVVRVNTLIQQWQMEELT